MFVDEKQQGEAKPVQIGTLKLSEAMRIGARLRPQGFTAGLVREGDGTSCALQAAAEGKTGRFLVWTNECARALGIEEWLMEKIYFLNDVERWSRERIADWLESQGY
jgi:hypothetical protein